MVTFEVFFNDNKIAKYHYWAQGDKSKRPGIITVDLNTGFIEVTEIAEDDWKRIITAEELNKFLDSLNELRRERNEEPYDDYTDKDEISYFFADHAFSTIHKKLVEGELIKEGSSAWY